MRNEFKKVVETAFKLACHGDIILLSPACASFDMFRNFEERGGVFKQLVNELAVEYAKAKS